MVALSNAGQHTKISQGILVLTDWDSWPAALRANYEQHVTLGFELKLSSSNESLHTNGFTKELKLCLRKLQNIPRPLFDGLIPLPSNLIGPCVELYSNNTETREVVAVWCYKIY